jgi:hypothetical protein
MNSNQSVDLKSKYRHVFMVDTLHYWKGHRQNYVPTLDLVLTYDLGLYKFIQEEGGDVFYVDHLVDAQRMQVNNFISYQFFKDWHFAADGQDIFKYKGIPFGFSFRLEIWNDLISYIRTYLCLSRLSEVDADLIIMISDNEVISSILKTLKITFTIVKPDNLSAEEPSYFFPIAQWMDEKIRPKGLRAFLYKAREWVSAIYGHSIPVIDKFLSKKIKATIFMQEYHPTRKLIAHFRKDDEIKVLLTNFSRQTKLTENLKERLLPISGSLQKYEDSASQLMAEFEERRTASLVLDGGADITIEAYNLIEDRIKDRVAYTLRTLGSCIKYLDKHPVSLEVLIANIGHTATLFDCVCKQRGIPSYLIINGLLGPQYSDESKYATVINSYSESIKTHYYRGMDNIVVLGDPRMDMYPPELHKPNLNIHSPTVTIGASGFNSVDLNSYVAVEFDFMHDVLSALTIIKTRGTNIKPIIKVRGNGYRVQYENFVETFFPELDCEIIDTTTMKEILMKTDFYISIYSQTLFEASCLGIPVVYYKKDNEIKDTPFDGCSELVTVDNIDDLVTAFGAFQHNRGRYQDFLRRDVMEKYIGPLDGGNLERNKAYIYSLLDGQS